MNLWLENQADRKFLLTFHRGGFFWPYPITMDETKQRGKKPAEAVNDFFLKNNGNNNKIDSIDKCTVKHVVLTEKKKSNIF